MAGSDVRAKRLAATGSAGVGPARIRQVQVKTTSGHGLRCLGHAFGKHSG